MEDAVKKIKETSGIDPVVIEEIRGLAEHYGLEKVLLFGSRARERYYQMFCSLKKEIEENWC